MYSQVTNKAKPGKVAPEDIHYHFSRIADRYRDLRTTDLEPIAFIARELSGLPCIEAADIGCGAGRYDLLLFEHLGDKLRLACVDANSDMLKALDTHLKGHGIREFRVMNSRAESLPFPNDALDCVFSFNAVHHFSLPHFLKESARILKRGGHLFVYTRLQEQNRRNIWGRYFPDFCRKETRLYRLNTFVQTVMEVPALRARSIEYYTYERIATLEQLVERARSHHYSTFWLYSPEELEEAIAGFRRNIEGHFEDIHRVKWFDENVLFVIRKEE
jgi:ubiquinone/menaquinone biosynthesis C-methylase UbiE